MLTASLSYIIGRSVAKDLFVLALTGAGMGLIVGLHMSSIAIIFDSATWSKVMTFGVAWKVVNHVIVLWIGYPIARAFESLVRR